MNNAGKPICAFCGRDTGDDAQHLYVEFGDTRHEPACQFFVHFECLRAAMHPRIASVVVGLRA